MNSDQLAYEVFVVDPEGYFEAIGQPRTEAANYDFHAIDLKAVERRLDGYFEPKDSIHPLHFVEVLFYKKENAYANIFAKVFLKLEQDSSRDWFAAIFFASEKLSPSFEDPYRVLLQSDRVKRVFLDALPDNQRGGLGLAILKLATKSRGDVAQDAKLLVRRVKSEIAPIEKKVKLLELVEFVVISKLSNLSREEIQTMLELDDYRQSRFYQEARQDGIKEGKEEGKIEGKIEGKTEMLRENIRRMATKGIEAKSIAEILEVDIEFVRATLKTTTA